MSGSDASATVAFPGATVLGLDNGRPTFGQDAWVAPGATIVGDVHLGAGVSIWYGAVLRADGDSLAIGEDSNVQDGCVMHTDPGRPIRLGARVTVGHQAVVHGCTVEDDVLVGMGSVLMNGVYVGRGSLIAAGAVLLEGTEVPPGSLVAGVPGKVRRTLTSDEHTTIENAAADYVRLRQRHAAGATAST